MLPDIAAVDAESTTRRHLVLALTPLGYQVVSFPDARRALREIVAAPPKLVIADLLLPDMDGFELFHEIRSALGDRIQLLCTSGVEWGQINLAEVLGRRFGARLLKKPFLKSELKELVRELIGPGPHQPSFSSEWRIGVEDATRIEGLVHDFETCIARVGLSRGRCSVRRPLECTVLVKSVGEWIRCTAKNISTGGLFVEMTASTPDDWPRLDETLEVSVETGPFGRGLRARARVAFCLTAQDAAVLGARPGFGMEFVDLAEEDRRALDLLVQTLRPEDEAEHRPEQADANLPPVIWVLLVGIEAQELLRRPGFLHREGIEVMAVSTTEAAADFLTDHTPALCVVHEAALGPEPGRALGPLAQSMTAKRILVVGHTTQSSLVSSGLCDAILRLDTPLEILLEEVRERMGLTQRRAPRVPAQAEVTVHGETIEHLARMLNLSTGGMLLRSALPAQAGTHISVEFDLPDAAGLRCGAVVVRSQPDRQGTTHLWGLSFCEVDESTAQALSRFVESHVHFREFFSWLKGAYFSGRLGTER